MSAPLEQVTIEDKVNYNDFTLSTRGKLNEKEIKKKIDPEEIPLIIDLSINGYSSKSNFDIEVNNVKLSKFKTKCVEKPIDGISLTVKRACRVIRYETQDYIVNKKIVTPLFKQYSTKDSNEKLNSFAFIGGEHLVPEELAEELFILWKKFDKEKSTQVSKSIKRILNAKYERLGIQ
jgi:hypothetical protein